MNRIIFMFFIGMFLFSCATDGTQINQQLLDSVDQVDNSIDTFSVKRNGNSTAIQNTGFNSVTIDTSAPGADTFFVSKKIKQAVVTAETTNIVINPDQYPSFPGGESAMQTFIRKNKQYPLVAFQNEIKGIEKVRFVVETDGSLSGITVIQGLGYGCDENAIALIRKMPNWVPGKKGGVNVRCLVILPLSYGE